MPVPVTALEESIFGVGPYDDFAAEVGRFVWKLARPHWLRNEGHLIEVEAKLGILCPRRADAGQRMYFPIGTEAPLLDTDATRFVTNMSANQHKAFNGLLNERVMETNEPGYAGARIKYSHTREVDEFFENRTRVSRCQNTGEVRAVMVKEKLGSMDITCPRRPFDFRISVNLERPAGLPPSDVRPSYRRIKDRLSYAHQICQVDLTQVRTDESNAGLQHELEIEFRESGPLLESADRWADGAGDPTYLTYLQVWLNTVRLLIRNAPEE
ncbi:hypothetical protein CROQUDRAFT_43841 [Cronartium quercuum f. sp. fusiforme G11]|uniref:mRNA-capping enzyme subunit beta n=1 Tax=Cronartium quercuum f. sp. fusiforme G11 TaxID=708437 RepID=A0A9P6NH09_9BASI|nr:hypothetical protein CROQUDRAFT_43841 [Cronartium quercuum f. sp. fusiforme G11]